jgi:predicted lipoprotein with Yx(FWY)xxD motif
MTCQDATQARNARQHKESAKDSNHGLVPFDATALTLYTFRVDMILRTECGF